MSGGKETEGSLEFLEAAYAWHLPEPEWLIRLAECAARVWGRPRWSCGFTYDGSDVHRFQVSRPVVPGGSRSIEDLVWNGMTQQSPEFLSRNMRSLSMGFGRPLGAVTEDSDRVLSDLQTIDFFGINGLDATGKGCFIGIGAERPRLTTREILVFQRLAYHLSSAYRIRRRLQELQEDPLQTWEAILHPDGRLLEARGPAKPVNARLALHRAARSIEQAREQARGPREEQDPTALWRPRVRARWTLIDAFTRAGERYIVARENQTIAPELNALTERERQVVASAASGKANKEIGYELGVSHATVRVLLARACRRLGVRSRKQLFELPCIKALRGEGPPRRAGARY